jgi:hypothetical protein
VCGLVLIGVAVALLESGCGRKDDPLPPLIRKADMTRDLSVFQEGPESVLSWSYPSITTAGGPLPDVDAVEVWRATIPAGQEPPDLSRRDLEIRYQLLEAQGDLMATLDRAGLDEATRGAMLEFRDDLERWRRRYGSEERWVVWYAVRTICCRGRASDFSNIARLEPQLPPPPPDNLTAEAVAVGIALRWRPLPGTRTIVERSSGDDQWRVVTPEPVEGVAWRDTGAEQGRSWNYRLRSVRGLQGGGRVVGEPGAVVTLDYPDIYPPPSPANLVCLPEARLVRLRWDAARDAAWYVVARRVSGQWQQLASRHRELQYEDSTPPLGSVTYEVRAVDQAGNSSEAASCTTVVGSVP